MQQKEKMEELRQWTLHHLWIPMRPWNVLTAPNGFTIFKEGNGCRIVDINGKEYIDYYSCLMLNNLGYGRKEIAEAVYKQMIELHFVPTHEPTIPKIKLAKKLADLSPGSLSKVFFGLGGTDSIETALKIAKKYHKILGFPNRYKVLGGYTYHGSTYGAMSTGSRKPFTWEDFEPLMPGFINVPSPYCSSCDLALKYPECDLACAKFVDRIVQKEGTETVSAFIDVTIPSSCHYPPKEYWPMIRSICDKYGIILILDEVQCGLGRFGKMFACEHYDIVPDILVLAKALGGSYVPISAAIVKKEIAQKFERGPNEMLRHSYTYEGHTVACAAALISLEIMERENLVQNAEAMGKYLFEQLQSLKDHKIVGGIRGGLGLSCVVELVKERGSKMAFSFEENTRISNMLKERCLEAGLFGMFANPIPIIPPLIVTKDDVDEIVNRFDRVISGIEQELSV